MRPDNLGCRLFITAIYVYKAVHSSLLSSCAPSRSPLLSSASSGTSSQSRHLLATPIICRLRSYFSRQSQRSDGHWERWHSENIHIQEFLVKTKKKCFVSCGKDKIKDADGVIQSHLWDTPRLLFYQCIVPVEMEGFVDPGRKSNQRPCVRQWRLLPLVYTRSISCVKINGLKCFHTLAIYQIYNSRYVLESWKNKSLKVPH